MIGDGSWAVYGEWSAVGRSKIADYFE